MPEEHRDDARQDEGCAGKSSDVYVSKREAASMLGHTSEQNLAGKNGPQNLN